MFRKEKQRAINITQRALCGVLSLLTGRKRERGGEGRGEGRGEKGREGERREGGLENSEQKVIGFYSVFRKREKDLNLWGKIIMTHKHF